MIILVFITDLFEYTMLLGNNAKNKNVYPKGVLWLYTIIKSILQKIKRKIEVQNLFWLRVELNQWYFDQSIVLLGRT